MASTLQHNAARDDTDLHARLIARAEQLGHANALTTVHSNLGRLVAAPVDGGLTIADIHASAVVGYEAAVAALPPRPGANPAAVTDAHLEAALQAILAAQ